MQLSDFDYELPPEQIAQTPIEPRDASRLLVLNRADGTLEHTHFNQIGEYLRPGDVLVLNQPRVIPARLVGQKAESGGKVEFLLLHPRDSRSWHGLIGGKGVTVGTRL
ncbi:MAG: S-adenosylmethionine:tRNA ribosyltransferase-isomerase, partial [Anaerolineae bacterium]